MTRRSDTMFPIYFPFTFIQENIAAIFHDIFGKVVVYQPNAFTIDPKTAQYSQEERIELRIPVTGDETILNDLIKKYKEFGNLHDDELKTFTSIDPNDSNDESFITQIQSQIIENKKNTHSGKDELLSASLFLQMAQNFDMQQYEIDHELELSEKKRRIMFSDLKGLSMTDNMAEKNNFIYDYGDYQTKARIDAWTRLYQKDTKAHPFLITHSRVCLDQLFSILPGWDLVYSYDGAPCFKDVSHRQSWMDSLDRLTQISWEGGDIAALRSIPATSPEKYSFQLFICPDTTTEKLTSAILNQNTSSPGIKSKYLNMLIGFLEIKI